MGRIIHCADLVLKVDDDTVIGNISQWILESTEFRPTNMETCTIRDEMDTYQKLWLIMVVWLTLVLFSFLYCYFCEQRLFQGSQRLFDRSQADAKIFNSCKMPLTALSPLLNRLWTRRACWRMGSAQTRSATSNTRGDQPQPCCIFLPPCRDSRRLQHINVAPMFTPIVCARAHPCHVVSNATLSGSDHQPRGLASQLSGLPALRMIMQRKKSLPVPVATLMHSPTGFLLPWASLEDWRSPLKDMPGTGKDWGRSREDCNNSEILPFFMPNSPNIFQFSKVVPHDNKDLP